MSDSIDSPFGYAPIIGILCVDIAEKLRSKYGPQYTSYLPASYVKFVEGGGGRVVPIWIGKSREYYEQMLTRINGVLLPGGAVFFNEDKGYAEAATWIYEIASSMNKMGLHMPIFGICLGCELLLYASAGCELRQDCCSIATSLTLNFCECAKVSRFFGEAPEEIIQIFSTENVAYNNHRYCVTEDDLQDRKIRKHWNILTTSSDQMVANYISSVEHREYPFYGIQFHPERPIYEHRFANVVRSANAIKCSCYIAQFFVNEARKSRNRFEEEQEYRYLIHNFIPTVTYDKDIRWMQCYIFKDNVDYPEKN